MGGVLLNQLDIVTVLKKHSPAVKEHFWWKTFFHNLIFLYISYGNNTSQKVPASSGLYFVSPGALTWEVFKPNHQWISPTCIGKSVKQWFFGRIYKYTDLFETLKLVLNNILIPLLDCQLMCPSLYVWVLGWMNVLKRLLSGIIAVSLSATPSTNDSEVVSFDTRKKKRSTQTKRKQRKRAQMITGYKRKSILDDMLKIWKGKRIGRGSTYFQYASIFHYLESQFTKFKWSRNHKNICQV